MIIQEVVGGAQRLDRTTETVQRPHGAKDVSGTGPLASVLSQESLFAAKGGPGADAGHQALESRRTWQ